MPGARRIAVALATSLLVVGGVVVLGLDPLARHAAERAGQDAMQTPVAADAASVHLLQPGVELRGLRVANPPGFSQEPLLSVERLALRVEPSSLRADTIVVPEIVVDGYEMRLERVGHATNLEALRKRIRERLKATAGAAGEQRIQIGRLALRGGRVSAALPLGKRASFPLKDLELTDIGAEKGGLEPAQLADLLFKLSDPGVKNALKNVDVGGIVKGIFR